MSIEKQMIISKRKIRQAFDRAAESYDEAAVLQREVCHRLLEKLEYIKLTPEWILDAGVGTGEAVIPLLKRFKKSRLVALDLSERMLVKARHHRALLRKPELVCADIEQLPFGDNSFELIFSSLTLQWCNDLDTSLRDLYRILRPGGLLLFTTFGPDTLKELRASWHQIDDAVHVNQFTDMHDIGDGLLQAGYADPVMEAEMMTLQYSRVDQLMTDLRAIGANVPAAGRRQGLLTPSALNRLRAAYETYRVDQLLPATYEVIYGHAWKPVASPRANAEIRVDLSR
jgi:malonyl-CoA O-methyltransferase